MKVLFLDIDGVLNSELYYKSRLKNKLNFKFFKFFGLKKLYHWLIDAHNKESWLLSQIDEICVKLLNHVVEETGCKIVISSTWRKTNGGWKYLQTLLEKKGFIGEVIGETPVLWTERGKEILDWISKTPSVTNYVIVDDDSDFSDKQKLKHFVWCDPYCGFSPNTAYKCKWMLNGNISKINHKNILIESLTNDVERL